MFQARIPSGICAALAVAGLISLSVAAQAQQEQIYSYNEADYPGYTPEQVCPVVCESVGGTWANYAGGNNDGIMNCACSMPTGTEAPPEQVESPPETITPPNPVMPPTTEPGGGGIDHQTTAQLLLQKINGYRRGAGLSDLRFENRLVASTTNFANYIAQTMNFSHEADGRKWYDRVAADGYSCVVEENLGQILFWQAQTSDKLAEEFLKQWQKSPPHNDTMLNGTPVEAGIGVSKGTDRYFAVLVTGRGGC